MGLLLKFVLCIYLISLIFSIFIAVVKFWVDSSKWHKTEKFFEDEVQGDNNKHEIKEVSENVEPDKHNSFSIFGTGDKS